ncbi:hypothetical protein RO3G_04462 [Rhizopus delemar RA 99-880]|uniref:Uncharacterized protein n=1 Tax=Rhizopus delemar (strain RA 99-880 / ATCC MYA-4621 / FGSC 9543 / NRRL 43880) TaxID=246409 RepID=I1BU77_RHIO9|nr:hypothetical protein RO3G_04462 [Rhizopus delemar RA 99-880]|eukprot:EIE79757.1 hypothetical protein RO3G_04462 [Rhizopus delemar RA 99-880]
MPLNGVGWDLILYLYADPGKAVTRFNSDISATRILCHTPSKAMHHLLVKCPVQLFI